VRLQGLTFVNGASGKVTSDSFRIRRNLVAAGEPEQTEQQRCGQEDFPILHFVRICLSLKNGFGRVDAGGW
jgi:hypothetical protein